jgi:hypothetical protein
VKHIKWFTLVIVVLAMAALACNAGKAPATEVAATAPPAAVGPTAVQPTAVAPAETATVEAVPTVAVVTTTADEEELSLESITEGLAQLGCYKSSFTAQFVGKDAQGKAVDNTWVMAEEFILEPRAQHVVYVNSRSSEGRVVESSRMEMMTIGQTTYLITQESDGTTSCISISSTDASPASQGLSPDMWGGVSNAKYVNTETVNGIRAKHYTWKEGSYAGYGWLTGKGETWVAEEGGFVVKQVLEGTGAGFLVADSTHEGTTTVEYQVTDVNGSFKILPPAECEGPSTDIPVLADAVEKMTFGDMISYRTPTSFADVASFYSERMVAAGWQASGEPTEMEGYAQFSYTKDTRTAMVMLTLDTSTQETTVFIQVTKE